MTFDLNPIECRILGALVEKELTTPDYYPLSLNALINACNQKSNRLPVMSLNEDEVITALDRLRHLGLSLQSSEGGRVAKFCHSLPAKLHLDDKELAILAELLLRGAQTPGELRARADRMSSFEQLEEVNSALLELIERDVPLIAKLPRQAGRKEHRYIHLLGDEELLVDEIPQGGPVISETTMDRTESLREEVAALRQELTNLRNEFEEFRNQFD